MGNPIIELPMEESFLSKFNCCTKSKNHYNRDIIILFITDRLIEGIVSQSNNRAEETDSKWIATYEFKQYVLTLIKIGISKLPTTFMHKKTHGLWPNGLLYNFR